MNWLWNNSQWLFSGIGASVIVLLVTTMISRKIRKHTERTALVLPLVDVTRKELQNQRKEIERSNYFYRDRNSFQKIIEEHKLTTAYQQLPKKILIDVSQLLESLERLAKISGVIRAEMLKIYESIPNRTGGDGRQIIVTELLIMSEDKLPNDIVILTFPREVKNSALTVKLRPEQVREFWNSARDKVSVEDYGALRQEVLTRIDAMDSALHRLQK